MDGARLPLNGPLVAPYLSFRVMGIPVPQGSARAWVHNGHARITDSNRNLKDWRHAVRSEAQRAMEEFHVAQLRKKDCAVSVHAFFNFPKPVSKSKRVVEMVTRPDLDKLIRAVGDALTGTVYEDDSQVVSVTAEKRYTSEGDMSGAFVLIYTRPTMLEKGKATR